MAQSAQFMSFFFRYRGTFDLKYLYQKGRSYYVSRGYKFNEKKIKFKSDEFEGVWDIEYRFDAYHQFKFTVEWHCYDMVPTTMKDHNGNDTQGYTGKIWIRIDPTIVWNYEEKTIAGPVDIFHDKSDEPGKESWLHKIYKRVTFRERDDTHEYNLIMAAQGFIKYMKELTGVDAK